MADLLTIEHLSAGYGEAVVLSNVSLSLSEGRALALLGRNGMGKTTLINTIVGVTRYFAGKIVLDGRDLTRLRPDQRAHLGVGWVPQERNIFKSLSVQENLTAVARPGRWTTDKVYALFPRLAERRGNLGNQLSGGEQQMLAVGRALVLNPRVMLLDEPLEGLAPILVEELLAALHRVIRDEGMSAIWSSRTRKKSSASPTRPSSSSVAPSFMPPTVPRCWPTAPRSRPISASPIAARASTDARGISSSFEVRHCERKRSDPALCRQLWIASSLRSSQ